MGKNKYYRKIEIFVAAPNDVQAEREILKTVVNELNRGIANHFNFILEIKEWSQVPPGMGRPEDVILNNLPIENWDIFIGILWKRFGIPSGGVDPQSGKRFISGTEEEFKLAYLSWKKTRKPYIMFYQCKRPIGIDEIDIDQLNRVKAFFAEFNHDAKHPGLYKSYKAIEEFQQIVRDDLTSLLVERKNTLDTSIPNSETTKSHIVSFKDKEYIYIPGGAFDMGTNWQYFRDLEEAVHLEALRIESPQHKVNLEGFYIARYPVTNAEYLSFINETGGAIPYRDDFISEPFNWNPNTRVFPEGKGNHPVVLVSWYDALSYCRWLGGRLPTEAEWEKAARGVDSREWPWGNEWLDGLCNTEESGIKYTTIVGHFSPEGDSPYGVGDMAGNVWEWCSSLRKPYPYKADDGREKLNIPGLRVIRGGAWGVRNFYARCAFRGGTTPEDYGFSIGFRVVLVKNASNNYQSTNEND